MPTSARPPSHATHFADRTHPKPPPCAQGEASRRSRDGGDQSQQKPGQTIPQSRFASQLPLHKGACPPRRKGGQRSAIVHLTLRQGGYIIRPYSRIPNVGAACMAARAGRRFLLHPCRTHTWRVQTRAHNRQPAPTRQGTGCVIHLRCRSKRSCDRRCRRCPPNRHRRCSGRERAPAPRRFPPDPGCASP